MIRTPTIAMDGTRVAISKTGGHFQTSDWPTGWTFSKVRAWRHNEIEQKQISGEPADHSFASCVVQSLKFVCMIIYFRSAQKCKYIVIIKVQWKVLVDWWI